MKVFSVSTGEAFERDSCDVREMIATGEYTTVDPATAAATATAAAPVADAAAADEGKAAKKK